MRNPLHSQQRQALIEKHQAAAQNLQTIEADKKSPPTAHVKLFENRICLSITEFAAQSGVSPKTIERMIKRGEIHAKHVGRRVVIPTSAIEAWLNRKE